MIVKIVPKNDRIATTERVVKKLAQIPRCAVKTANGQCSGTINGEGAASGFREINGEMVPLCGRHYGGV